ncbi:MAG: ribonuclease BN, partial [Akkermansiaceae bacterium]|nr:ribonuclease BN [Akkermansiaceae bacterium]
SWYATELVDLGKTYGSLGGVVLLLLWLFSLSFAMLLGAELDAEIEHQTVLDSTTGRERPRGERGAFVADTVGAAKREDDSWLEPARDQDGQAEES